MQIVYFAEVPGKGLWKQLDGFTGSKDFGKLSKGSRRRFFPCGEYVSETRISDYFVQKNETENGDLYEKVWKETAGLRKSGKLLERFGRISCPLVLIQGVVAQHPSEGVIQPLRVRNVDIKSYVFDKCGHTPWREKYSREEFAEVLFSELEG